jgi:uncharacterized protein YbjQ (UPF0145 family)
MASSSKEKTASADLGEPHCFTETNGIITSTMNDLPGYRVVRTLGTVYGLCVRSRNWGADIASLLKSIVGGELRYLTNMLYASRNDAVGRMVGEAMGRGANAIIAMRFDASEIMGFGQVCAYGTAVVVEKVE